MSRARHIASIVAMAGFLAFTTGTSKRKTDTGSSSGAQPLPPPPPPTFTQNTSPPDIDPLLISITLGCDAKPGNVGCKLLKDFDTADTFVDLPISDAVWFGESNAIGGVADGKKELFFLQVSGGSLGFSGSARTLLPDNAKETQDAQRLLAATKVGSTVAGSGAAVFMRTSVPIGGKRTILKSRGRSQTLAQTPTQVFIRARGDRVLIVEYTGNFLVHEFGKGPGSALAWVSEVFKLR